MKKLFIVLGLALCATAVFAQPKLQKNNIAFLYFASDSSNLTF